VIESGTADHTQSSSRKEERKMRRFVGKVVVSSVKEEIERQDEKSQWRK
jgi:hypothetical protein